MSLGDFEFLNDETTDFAVKPSPDGVWCWLTCSVHGNVTAATWPNRDLLGLMVEAKSHYERKHEGSNARMAELATPVTIVAPDGL